MFSEYIRTHKISFFLIALLVLGSVGYGVYIAVSRAGKEAVQVYLLPGDAALTANGERLGSGTAYLTPGEYEIKATKEGFEDFNQKITITSPNTAEIDVALKPQSEEAKKWVSENQKLYQEYEGRAGKRANQEGEEFSEKNPITSKLPVSTFLFTIGYRLDTADPSGNSIIITIAAPEGYRRAALERFRDLGYDPTDYTIEFTNYKNLFESYE